MMIHFRFLLEELRYGGKQVITFVICVALSIATLTALNSFRRDVHGSLIDEARASASMGLALVDPVADTVLPLEPVDVPDPARTIMEQARDDMFEGRDAYRSARDTLVRAAELLADIVGSEAA